MTLPVAGHLNAPQIRVPLEDDAEQIVDFALGPIRRLPDAGRARQLRTLARDAAEDAHPDRRSGLRDGRRRGRQLQKMIDDVVARFALRVIHRAQIQQHREAAGRELLQTRVQSGGFDALDDGVVDRRTKLGGSIARPAMGGVCVLGTSVSLYDRARMPPRPPSRICCWIRFTA